MVDVTRTGQPVYVGDLAQIQRMYKDPTQYARSRGERGAARDAFMATKQQPLSEKELLLVDALKKAVALYRKKADASPSPDDVAPDIEGDIIDDKPNAIGGVNR